MPSINQFENKKKKTGVAKDIDLKAKSESTKKQRRPRHDEEAAPEHEDMIHKVEEETHQSANYQPHMAPEEATFESEEEVTEFTFKADESAPGAEEEIKPTEFFGHEILRAKFPQPMQFVDKVAHEWTHDGRFNDLPISHPLAQALVGEGFRRAKKVEKKLEETGVLFIIKSQVAFLKHKIEEKRNKHTK